MFDDLLDPLPPTPSVEMRVEVRRRAERLRRRRRRGVAIGATVSATVVLAAGVVATNGETNELVRTSGSAADSSTIEPSVEVTAATTPASTPPTTAPEPTPASSQVPHAPSWIAASYSTFLDDLATSKSAVGAVSVGDPCDGADPTYLRDPSAPQPVLVPVASQDTRSCTIVGWAYRGPVPSDVPYQAPADGRDHTPIFNEDGSLLEWRPAGAPTSTTPAVAPREAALDAWPPTTPASLADVPPFLPSISMGDVRAVGSAGVDDGTGVRDAYQAYYDAERDAYVVITTNLAQVDTTPVDSRTLIESAGWATRWDEVYLVASASPYVNVHLAASGGTVSVNAYGLEQAEVLDMASSMVRADDTGAGWDVPLLPDGMTTFAASAGSPRGGRSIRWFDDTGELVAQLDVMLDNPDVLRTAWLGGSDVDTIDLGGTTALVASDDDRTAVIWSPTPNVQVLFGSLGDRNTVLAIAASVRQVDEATWDAATEPPGRDMDGCNSLFC